MDGKLRNMTSVYLTGEKGILCLYRIGSRVANNKFIGSAGGHFEESELNDPKACVLREMQEELGLTEADVEDLKLRYITHRHMAGEIRQNYYFFGKLKTPEHKLILPFIVILVLAIILPEALGSGHELIEEAGEGILSLKVLLMLL